MKPGKEDTATPIGTVTILLNKVEPDHLLARIFKIKPLPNTLKVPKRKFETGVLGWNSKIRIIEQFSNCQCRVICERKDSALGKIIEV